MDTTLWLHDLELRLDERLGRSRCPQSLTVVFDPNCAICRRCRDWMLRQDTYVALNFLPCTAEEAQTRFGDLPWLGDELVVIGDAGEVWVGPAAFLTCLWALSEYREWSYRLAGPAFAPLAERFFLLVSDKRRALSRLFAHDCDEKQCK
jgi:predicted DCC family thiol-disulfide oxidoreductase YuxK